MRTGRRSVIVAALGMIHRMLARAAAATMPPAAPVQRKAILLSIIAVRAVLPVRSVIAVLRLLMLLLLLRLIVLLIVMLLARMIRLRLAWGERLAAEAWLLAIAVVVALIGPAHLAGLLLMVIFRRDRIAGALRVTSELQILFGDVGRGSADFYVRPVRFIRPRQWILMMPTLAVTTA